MGLGHCIPITKILTFPYPLQASALLVVNPQTVYRNPYAGEDPTSPAYIGFCFWRLNAMALFKTLSGKWRYEFEVNKARYTGSGYATKKEARTAMEQHRNSVKGEGG